MRQNWKIPFWDLATCIFITLYHFIDVVVMNTTRSKHETIHTHSQMFSFSFQTFPNKHAGSWFSCNLACLSRKRLNVFWNKVNKNDLIFFMIGRTTLHFFKRYFLFLYFAEIICIFASQTCQVAGESGTWMFVWECPNVFLQFLNIPKQTCRFLILLQPGMFVSQKIVCLLKKRTWNWYKI